MWVEHSPPPPTTPYGSIKCEPSKLFDRFAYPGFSTISFSPHFRLPSVLFAYTIIYPLADLASINMTFPEIPGHPIEFNLV